MEFAKGEREVALDHRMGECPARHRLGADSVELVAQRRPLLQGEEFGKRHGLGQGDVIDIPFVTN